MPAPAVVQNQIKTLESGLKSLRKSKLMTLKEFKAMYGAIDQHHREVKLAHIAGKAKDILQQVEQDTQFYYILVKMLFEVSSCHARYQQDNLKQVYNWYQDNSQVLHSGPRFGRAKKSDMTERPKLQTGLTPRQPSASSNNSSSNQPMTDVQNKQGSQSEDKSSAAVPEMMLPKRVHPLTHLINPHVGQLPHAVARPDSSSEVESPSEGTTPVRLQVETPVKISARVENKTADASVRGGGDGFTLSKLVLRTNQLRKWDAYQHDLGYGQDILGKLQYMGRAGTPFGVRYTAHDQGLMAENFTTDIISEYTQTQRPNSGKDAETGNMLLGRPLEEFYELSENYYPHKLPKYQSHKDKKSAGSEETRSKSASHLSQKNQQRSSPEDQVPVKLDALVNMIDTVTDEMMVYKEKLVPVPQPGFRQPVIGVEPSPLRPYTAPIVHPGATARPSSPVAQSRPEVKPSVNESIDWRGKVTPDSSNNKWDESGFSGHSYTKRPQTSLRTAGSVSAGNRPKTAPVSIRDKWNTQRVSDENQRAPSAASHTTTEVDPDMVNSLVNVQHLGGSAKRRRRYLAGLDYQMLYEIIPDDSQGEDMPSLEYLSFITPKYIQGSRVSSGIASSFDKDSQAPCMSPLMFEPDIIIPGLAKNGGTPADTDSLSAAIDQPDMRDVDEELSIMSETPAQDEQVSPKDELDTADSVADVVREATLDLSPVVSSTEAGIAKSEKENKEVEDQQTKVDTSRSKPGEPCKTASYGPNIHAANRGTRVVNASANGQYFSARNLINEINSLVGSPEDADIEASLPAARKSEAGDSGFPAEDALPSEDEDDIITVDQGKTDVTPSKSVTIVEPGEINYFITGNRVGPQTAEGQGYKRGSRSHKKSHVTRPRAPPKKQYSFLSDSKENILDTRQSRKSKDDSELNIVKQIEAIAKSPRAASALPSGRKTLQRPVTTPHVLKPRPPTEELDKDMLQIQGRSQKKGQGQTMRSAGRVPARAQSADPFRMLQKQQEMLRKAPAVPYRTAPSIPSQFSNLGTRSKKSGQLYCAELEAHARRDRSPRHYMQKVEGLRKSKTMMGDVGSPCDQDPEDQYLSATLVVNRLARRQQSSPQLRTPPVTPEADALSRVSDDTHHVINNLELGPRNLTRIGRPIAHYLEVNDPDEYSGAVQRQNEAKAAVDIQRIFRGFVARNHYKFLKKEVREEHEDRQKAAVEIQRIYRGHLARKKKIYNRSFNEETLEWARQYKGELCEREKERLSKYQNKARENAKNKAEADATLAVIGPHVEIYQNFHPKKTGPDRKVLTRAATAIQRWVRGHLIRLRFQMLKRKAKLHSNSWARFVGQYKELVRRIQERRGIAKPQAVFSFEEFNEFMDIKKKYESIFDQKAFSGELEADDINAFFKECDLYPSEMDIREAFDLIFRGRPKRGLKKSQVMEVVFQIYPPRAAGMADVRKSTWMSPIIDGEEAVKMMGTDHVEDTDYATCFKLVANTFKDRKEVERIMKEKEEEERSKRKNNKNKRTDHKNQAKDKTSAGKS